jgi:hypothetical protein
VTQERIGSNPRDQRMALFRMALLRIALFRIALFRMALFKMALLRMAFWVGALVAALAGAATPTTPRDMTAMRHAARRLFTRIRILLI